MADQRIGEFELIARCFKPLAAPEPGALSLSDDAAVLDLKPGERVVVTTDMLVAGVHFLADSHPRDVADKALRVNLSDLAAMGALPRGYVLALALPRDFRLDWVDGFSRELAEEQKRFGVSLVGGDTVATPGPLSLTITALGVVADDRFLPRSGARPGDDVWVSGTIGDAGLGLRVLQGDLPGLGADESRFLGERYHRPTPRLSLGRSLVGVAASAADVSDGLIADLGHICEASGVDAELEAEAIPRSAAAASGLAAAGLGPEFLWTAGDDYELVFTAPPAAAAQVAHAGARAGVEVHRIGRIVGKGSGRVAVRDSLGAEVLLAVRGHTHF